MSYNVYVTRIKNVRPHPNADRLMLGECFGNTVCVDLSIANETLGVYFPTDGQLSKEFAEANNLLRKKDENGNNVGGYMDPEKRNVTAIKLRGEKSDGLFLPLICLESFGDISILKEGDIVSIFNGHEIAIKYIPKGKPLESNYNKRSKVRKKKEPIAPLFMEHADTEQLVYNLNAFKPGDELEITLKMHGTSQRTGYLPTLKSYKKNLWDKITRKQGKPIYEYNYISGTRRTVLENYDGGFYGNNHFRQQHHDKFVNKLYKGETVYYEVVGFTDYGATIMGKGDNSKLGKDFVKQYGKETVFSYGCNTNESECYVYRMTMTNEDGFVVEYSPDFMRYRCEQIGVKYVPAFAKVYVKENAVVVHEINNKTVYGGHLKEDQSIGDAIKDIAEKYFDGPDPIGKTHVREGVVIRVVNKPKFTAYKHKNFSFKVLEGLIKDSAEAPDMEEAQEVETN